MACLGARASRPHAGQRPALPGDAGSGLGDPYLGIRGGALDIDGAGVDD